MYSESLKIVASEKGGKRDWEEVQGAPRLIFNV